MRKTSGWSKVVPLAAFLAGCSAGFAAACVCFAAEAPLLSAVFAAVLLAAAAAAYLLLHWKGEGGARAARVGAAKPRKASTAQFPREFNPRQAAVEELARVHLLTPREKEVLEFMARGRDVQFISESLVLSPNTVRTHVYSVFGKLGVHSRQELIDAVERACDACLLAAAPVGRKDAATWGEEPDGAAPTERGRRRA